MSILKFLKRIILIFPLLVVAMILLRILTIEPAQVLEQDVKNENKEDVKNVLATTSSQILPTFSISPSKIYPGDPVMITTKSDLSPEKIFVDGVSYPIFNYRGKFRAFAPVDFSEKRKSHEVLAVFSGGKSATSSIAITPREYIERPLGIPEKLGGNTPEASKKIVSNLAIENASLNSVETATTTLWKDDFAFPLSSIFITDDYGYSRATVGQTIIHKGTDFRAVPGTEVMAMNDGIVRLAQQYTVYGNTVAIDHGLGIHTYYMHLSRLDVKEGDVVRKGQIIGQSGDTGYAEAPHLHVSVKVAGISIDPMTFMRFFEGE